MSYAKRVDLNQKEIVDGLERYEGVTVLHLHTVGYNCPDILVGFSGKNYLFEIKSDKGEMTSGQLAFYGIWRGQTDVIYSLDEAIKIIEHFSRKKLVKRST